MSSIFGISERALQLSEDRAVILTKNIASNNTPNYKARDIDYYKLLQQAQQENTSPSSSVNSLSTEGSSLNEPLLYRVPMQNSLDKNTVDPEIERKNFIQNAMHYQVSLTFIQNKTDQLLKAIKGE